MTDIPTDGMPPGWKPPTVATPFGAQPDVVYYQCYCEHCNAPLPMGFGMSEGVAIMNMKVSCAHCGQLSRMMPDGGHLEAEQVDGRLRAVFHNMTPAELKALRSALHEAANEAGATVDDVLSVVEAASPGMAAWVRGWLSDQGNRMELWTVMTVLLAIVSVALTFKPDDPPQPQQVNQVILNIENGHYEVLPLPRQKPCFCGSGKRYNQCHGVGKSAGH